MAKHLSNIFLVVLTAIAAALVSLGISIYTGKGHWFGRSGAIVTMAGVILSVRPLVRMGFSEWSRSLKTFDAGHIEQTPEEKEVDRQSGIDATASQIGVYMALIGTLLWAYGDLIEHVLR